MLVTIQVALPDKGKAAGPATVWLESFRSWLDVTPAGVDVKIHTQPGEAVNEWVGIDDVKAFFRLTLPGRRVSYNARMVLFWLIQNMHRHLDVRCVRCKKRYRKCTCPESGYCGCGKTGNAWCYEALSAGSSAYQDAWVISRHSLQRLPYSFVDEVPDRSPLRVDRVRLFIQYVKGA